MSLHKYLISGFLFLCCNYTHVHAQVVTIPFDGNNIIIDGTMEQLTLLGHGESNIKIQLESRANNAEDFFDYAINGSSCHLSFLDHEQSFKVFLPSSSEIKIKPSPIVTEEYRKEEYGFIDLKDLNGAIELEADGYHVTLKNVSSQVSIVTYGDIAASMPVQNNKKIVSLDTYTGNIKVEIPVEENYSVSCNAVVGDVMIDNEVAKIDDTKPNIIAHAEQGAYIKVEAEKSYPISTISKPVLSKEIILLYMNYLGKKQISPELEKCIIDEGYENQLNALSQEGDRKSNQEKLGELIAKHGFPTKEMIGDKLAWRAVSMIFMWSDSDFIEKYKDEYAENFGWYNYKLNKKINQHRT